MTGKNKAVFAAVTLFILALSVPAAAAPLVTEEARSRRIGIFTVKPADFGIEPSQAHPHVWSLVLETAQPETVITFAATADGQANIYLGTGARITGAGNRPEVREAVRRVFETAEELRKRFEPAPRGILFPEPGEAKFYLFTFDSGILAAEAAEEEVAEGGHRLSPLYLAVQDVITEIRAAASE